MSTAGAMAPSPLPSDEELMRQLAAGRQDALGPLYSRYARLVFNLAAQSLDRPAAEEVVQDVFLTVWRKAAVFTPERGAFRPWALQIAHYRILNELRRRNRQPQQAPDDDMRLASLPDLAPEPDEAAWRDSLRTAVRSALEDLPPSQRQALDLAFFEDKTHEQVAAELNLPLGTAKTRIRSGLHRLRGKLAPAAVGFALVATLATAGVLYRAEYEGRMRDERALALLTSSTTESFRLKAAPRVSPASHGQYHWRAGAPIVVLTVSNLSPAPEGQVYQAWFLQEGTWKSLGVLHPDAGGSSRLVAEGPGLTVRPEAVQVTLESARGGPAPRGPVVIRWTAGE